MSFASHLLYCSLSLESCCFSEFSHTRGVGTFVYASPEQLQGSSYDLKVIKCIQLGKCIEIVIKYISITSYNGQLIELPDSRHQVLLFSLNLVCQSIFPLCLQSDMYSVGVIAVELFQPFGTEMERVQTLGDLRNGKVPEDLYKTWPVLTEQIKLLTSLDPSLRPSASQLLQNDFFNNKDTVCAPPVTSKFCI